MWQQNLLLAVSLLHVGTSSDSEDESVDATSESSSRLPRDRQGSARTRESNRYRGGPRGVSRPGVPNAAGPQRAGLVGDARRGTVEWVYWGHDCPRSLHGAASIMPDHFLVGETRAIYAFPWANQECNLWHLTRGAPVEFRIHHNPRDINNPEDFRVDAVSVRRIQAEARPERQPDSDRREPTRTSDLDLRLENAHLKGYLSAQKDELECRRASAGEGTTPAWWTNYYWQTSDTGEPTPSQPTPPPERTPRETATTEFRPVRMEARPDGEHQSTRRSSTPYPHYSREEVLRVQSLRQRVLAHEQGRSSRDRQPSRDPEASASNRDPPTREELVGEHLVGMMHDLLQEVTQGSAIEQIHTQGGPTIEEIVEDDMPEQPNQHPLTGPSTVEQTSVEVTAAQPTQEDDASSQPSQD